MGNELRGIWQLILLLCNIYSVTFKRTIKMYVERFRNRQYVSLKIKPQ